MSEHSAVLETQVRAMTQELDAYLDTHRREILERAAREAGELLRAARRRARERVHEGIVRERGRVETRLRAAQAHRRTQLRQRRQEKDRILLRLAWERLPGAVEARWRDPVSRRLWIEAASAEASRVLGRSAWRLEHGPDWTDADSALIGDLLPAGNGLQIERVPCDDIVAGLRILALGARLDATLEGLLCDRVEIEGALLGELARLEPPEPAGE